MARLASALVFALLATCVAGQQRKQQPQQRQQQQQQQQQQQRQQQQQQQSGGGSSGGGQRQVDALLAIKDAVDQGGKMLGDWSRANAGNYCRWQGVFCNSAGGVTALTIWQREGGAAFGSLPPASALNALPALWSLKVNGWGVRGALPAEYGGVNLGELVLTVDGMGGGIPAEWGNMRNMRRLVLKYCNLTGPLPAALGRMSNLEELNVTVNGLTGSLPGELGALGKLKVLDVSLNKFTGNVPAGWGGLYSLETLDMSHNVDLTGKLPAEWRGMKSIKTLLAIDCNIYGQITAEMAGAWSQLVDLEMPGNLLSGALPSNWAGSLQTFDLSHNQLSGPLPAKIGNPKVLLLGYNTFTSSIPSSWGYDLKRVELLNLEYNKLWGAMPPAVPAWSNRWPPVKLFFAGNFFTGQLPVEWKTLNPEVFSLRDNVITGTLPADYGWFWKRTTDIDLARNNITGTLPAAWSNLPALETLDLSHNLITGSLPKEWSRLLGRAKTIFLARNRLSGSIPQEWGSATGGSKEFYRFDVRQNRRLDGCLPRGMERFAYTTNPFSSLYFDGTGIGSVC